MSKDKWSLLRFTELCKALVDNTVYSRTQAAVIAAQLSAEGYLCKSELVEENSLRVTMKYHNDPKPIACLCIQSENI